MLSRLLRCLVAAACLFALSVWTAPAQAAPTYTDPSFLTVTSYPEPATFANLKPGDTVWWHITAKNAGEEQVLLTVRVNVSSSLLTSALQVTFGTCAPTGVTCGTVVPTFAGTMNHLSGHSHDLDPLEARAAVTFLVGVTLPTAAGNDLQSVSAAIEVRVTGTQFGDVPPIYRGDELAFTGLHQYLLVAGLGLIIVGVLFTRLTFRRPQR